MEVVGFIFGVFLVVIVLGTVLALIGLASYRMIIWQLRKVPRFKNKQEGRHSNNGTHAI